MAESQTKNVYGQKKSMSDIKNTMSAAEQAFIDAAVARCRERGVSLTPIRRCVLVLLRRHGGGLKAYDLLDQIKVYHPTVSPPTVYRALDFLIEQGLAHRIGRINQFVACNQHDHDHVDANLFLVCPKCGIITELHDEAALIVLARSLKAAGHTLSGPEIEISAICRYCSDR